jgi:hypothetical protein
MSIRRTLAVAGALAAVAGYVAVPSANAAPKPGDSCSASDTSADSALWCDMQAGLWVSRGTATLGQPCSTPGDVRLAGGENLAHCAQTGSGQVWVAGSR